MSDCGCEGSAPAGTSPAYFIGKTERETTLNQFRYISVEYRRLARVVDAVLSVLKTVHNYIDTKCPEQVKLPLIMLLDGTISTLMNKEKLISFNIDETNKYIAEADGEEPIPFKPVIQEATPREPIPPEGITEFNAAMRHILDARNMLQEIYTRHYPDKKYVLQMGLSVVDPETMSNVKFKDLDIDGFIANLVKGALEKKLEDGEVIGLKEKEKEANENSHPSPLFRI